MSRPCILVLAGLTVAGCNEPFVTPETSTPVGLGLKATFGVAETDCEDSLVNNSCHDDALVLRSGRATNEHAAFVGVQDTVAMFRGVSVGLATAEIETAGDDSYDFEFEVVEIDEQRLEMVEEPFADIYPVEAPAYLTRSTVKLRHVRQSYSFTGYLQDVRGIADIDVETVDTQVRIGETAILIDLITGALPGKAILHTSSGLAHHVQIAGPDQIAGLDLYDGSRHTTSLVVGKTAKRITVVPLLADHRAIGGCGADQPRVTVSSNVVQAAIAEGGSYCTINVLRLDPGSATVTIAWGSATATLPVEDPPAP